MTLFFFLLLSSSFFFFLLLFFFFLLSFCPDTYFSFLLATFGTYFFKSMNCVWLFFYYIQVRRHCCFQLFFFGPRVCCLLLSDRSLISLFFQSNPVLETFFIFSLFSFWIFFIFYPKFPRGKQTREKKKFRWLPAVYVAPLKVSCSFHCLSPRCTHHISCASWRC